MKTRLDRILALSGLGSRSDVKKMIRKKNCCVDGVRIVSPSFILDTDLNKITIDGEPLVLRTNVYLMFNKPQGCVTSTSDPVHKTVMDYIKAPFDRMKLFPIGRLDIDTEGLLIITDDGEITHKITSPKSGTVKTYYLELSREPSDEELKNYCEEFEKGIMLKNGYKCLPAKFEKCENKTGSFRSGFLMHITEGKFHQVKKMLEAVGNKVTYLQRTAFAKLKLNDLALGEVKEINLEDII